MCTFAPWTEISAYDGIADNSITCSDDSDGSDGQDHHREDPSSHQITTNIDTQSMGYYQLFF